MRNPVATLCLLLSITGAVIYCDRVGAFRHLEDTSLALRMSYESREASGQIVLAAIDQRSIQELSSWPWPRDTHAALLDRLLELGAKEVFFDVDFSSPSTPSADARLADAMQRAGGRVLLPAFRQTSGVGLHAAVTSQTFPIDLFRQHAWLVSANVRPNNDGHIWRYPYGHTIGNAYVQSAGAALAGRSGPADGSFVINYAIDPTSVLKFSVIDILNGTIHSEQIEGRSIVIGAYAAGLRDNLSVPVHGVISGAMLHILAAETLITDTVPNQLASTVPIIIVAALAALAILSPLGRKPIILSGLFSAGSLAIEMLALTFQVHAATMLPTPPLHVVLIVFALTIITRELDVRRWLAHGFRVDARNTNQLLKQVVSSSSDAILIVDEMGSILETNGQARALFPLDRAGRRNTTFSNVLPAELSVAVHDAMAALRAGHTMPQKIVSPYHHVKKAVYLECTVTPSQLEYKGRGSDLEERNIVAFVMMQDVTVAHTQRTQLNYLLHHDALTGALNRSGFIHGLGAIISDEGCDVLIVSLRRFRAVNSNFGRSVGDFVLREIVARLEASAPDPSCISRLGGDTFAVAYPSISIGSPKEAASNIHRALAEPFYVSGTTVHIEARIGAVRGGTCDSADGVISRAEMAVETARETGETATCIFEGSMLARQERSRRIERALRKAIEYGELRVMYDPQVDLRTYQATAARAIVRWKHPELGAVDQAEFVPIAESSGLTEALGRWVLKTACSDACRWTGGMSVSVGVSYRQLKSGLLENDVRNALRDSGLPPERLCLDIAESCLARFDDQMRELLSKLRRLGVSLALDDFGGGIVSPHQLATCSFTSIKMDQAFARDLNDDGWTNAMLATLVAYCGKSDLELVCKGVESVGQKERLVELGCKQAQGSHLGAPTSSSHFMPGSGPRVLPLRGFGRSACT